MNFTVCEKLTAPTFSFCNDAKCKWCQHRCQIHLNSWLRQRLWFQLMKLGQKVLGKKLFGLMMKQTFYGHFVAGEDQERIKPTIGRMQKWVDNEDSIVWVWSRGYNQVVKVSGFNWLYRNLFVNSIGVKSMVDFSVEVDKTGLSFLVWFLFFFNLLPWSLDRLFLSNPVSTYCNLLQLWSEINPGLLRRSGRGWGQERKGEEVLDIQEGEQDGTTWNGMDWILEMTYNFW